MHINTLHRRGKNGLSAVSFIFAIYQDKGQAPKTRLRGSESDVFLFGPLALRTSTACAIIPPWLEDISQGEAVYDDHEGTAGDRHEDAAAHTG